MCLVFPTGGVKIYRRNCVGRVERFVLLLQCHFLKGDNWNSLFAFSEKNIIFVYQNYYEEYGKISRWT